MEIINFIREKSVMVTSELSLKNESLPGREGRATTLAGAVGKQHVQRYRRLVRACHLGN